MVDKRWGNLSTIRAFENPRRPVRFGFLRPAAVRGSGRDVFWRDAAQRCGRHDKNDPLFGGFSSLRLLKIGISPGRKKVSYGKPTEN